MNNFLIDATPFIQNGDGVNQELEETDLALFPHWVEDRECLPFGEAKIKGAFPKIFRTGWGGPFSGRVGGQLNEFTIPVKGKYTHGFLDLQGPQGHFLQVVLFGVNKVFHTQVYEEEIFLKKFFLNALT